MTDRTSRRVGPVEYLVFDFPNGILSEEFAQELVDLATQGAVRLLDFVYLKRDCTGKFNATELDGVDFFVDYGCEIGGLIGNEDIRSVSENLTLGMSAALLLIEDLWAMPLADSLVLSGGSLIEGVRIPQNLAEAAIATLSDL